MTKQSNTKCFTDLNSFAELKQHFQSCKKLHMRRLFSVDPSRYKRMSLEFDWLLLDYSKNRITDKTLQLLFQLAQEADLEQSINNLFSSPPRGKTNKVCMQRRFKLAEAIHTGQYLGYSGKQITDIVNIGMTSSGLGPQNVCQALRPYHQPEAINLHFITAVDGYHLEEVLSSLNTETTLFIISSDAFNDTHSATMTHARAAKQWLLANTNANDAISKHFIGVTATTKPALDFGIPNEHIFEHSDNLEHTHTAWGSLGLPILLSIGKRHFLDFLEGIEAMDEHFRTEPFEKNMPVIMALIGIWYNNFFESDAHAVLPYDHNLRHVAQLIEQTDMQCNGKSLDRNGDPVNFATSPILWTGKSLNGHHAFYQMLHRAQKMVPADFIVSMRTHSRYQKQHDLMFANAIAQTEALMRGRTYTETLNDLTQKSASPTINSNESIHHRVYDGNNPSNMLLLQRLTPKSLGILLTAYEHKTYVQGSIWNLNAYDQTGLGLGNTLSNTVLSDIFMPSNTKSHDASTNALINHYRTMVYPRKDTTP